MHIRHATDDTVWDAFLASQPVRPFLQSWTMGEVYREIGQTPIRLIIEDASETVAICFGHIVQAKRGDHLAIPYGPVLTQGMKDMRRQAVFDLIANELQTIAKAHRCSFIRISPFWSTGDALSATSLHAAVQPCSNTIHHRHGVIASPLHLLAEHVWYLPLQSPNPWQSTTLTNSSATQQSSHAAKYPDETRRQVCEDELLAAMRKTTRNLIRRAERDGVTIEASKNPMEDVVQHFIRLHDDTRKRHGFTPYTNTFFQAQVKHFSKRSECTIYLARYQGDVIASSIHLHAFGETSYHHGASSSIHHKIPASYLLQWRAIQDAIKRRDRIYNFWGIAPQSEKSNSQLSAANKHPFSGVTLFKTGFGGTLINLEHCFDIPVNWKYWLTYGFETTRKWRRGF